MRGKHKTLKRYFYSSINSGARAGGKIKALKAVRFQFVLARGMSEASLTNKHF